MPGGANVLDVRCGIEHLGQLTISCIERGTPDDASAMNA